MIWDFFLWILSVVMFSGMTVLFLFMLFKYYGRSYRQARDNPEEYLKAQRESPRYRSWSDKKILGFAKFAYYVILGYTIMAGVVTIVFFVMGLILLDH